MANALPLPANQVGSPCERRSPAWGKARHISRRRSTSGASREEMVLTGCVWGFAAGGTARGAPFFAVAFGAVVLMVPAWPLTACSPREDTPPRARQRCLANHDEVVKIPRTVDRHHLPPAIRPDEEAAAQPEPFVVAKHQPHIGRQPLPIGAGGVGQSAI